MKNQKGITLVALVITIIVLLILAGVSISLVIGQNGVLSKATNAVSENEKANVEQELKLGVADCQIEYYDAWVSNQSVEKWSYYKKATIEDSCTSGTITMTDPTTEVTEITGTYQVTNGGKYNFTITVSDGTVTVTPVVSGS